MMQHVFRDQPPTPAKELLAEFRKLEKEAEKLLGADRSDSCRLIPDHLRHCALWGIYLPSRALASRPKVGSLCNDLSSALPFSPPSCLIGRRK